MYLKIGLFLLGVVIFIGAKPYKSNMIEKTLKEHGFSHDVVYIDYETNNVKE